MAALTTYMWGGLGGAAAGIVVYVLPFLVQAALTPDSAITRDRIVAVTVLVAVLAAVAGVVALVPDDVSRGQAIAYGLASQAILRGLISSAADALPHTAAA